MSQLTTCDVTNDTHNDINAYVTKLYSSSIDPCLELNSITDSLAELDSILIVTGNLLISVSFKAIDHAFNTSLKSLLKFTHFCGKQSFFLEKMALFKSIRFSFVFQIF